MIGHAVRMGWKRRRGVDKFQIVIELDQLPEWPIDIVWKATPISLILVEPETKTAANAEVSA